MTRCTIVRSRVCDIQGCQNRATFSKRIKSFEQLDYEIGMKLCTRHKNYLKNDALVWIDLKAFEEEALLGVTKDARKQRIVNDAFDYMHTEAREKDREKSSTIPPQHG